jgi:hypothetical protein
MGESGRTGRFRVFTNLTPDTFKDFSVAASTPSIEIRDLQPNFPFIVDGSINIGPTAGGNYGLTASLGGKSLWHRDEIIRVVRPNIGETGLVQSVQAADGFHRPGDEARFLVLGSGFRPGDVAVLRAAIAGMDTARSSFTYLAPGRLELRVSIPATAATTSYALALYQNDKEIHSDPDAFRVVPANWTRALVVDPVLTPGGSARLKLIGRDLDAAFVASLKIAVDEPNLHIGAFSLVSPAEAGADITAGADVAPGDYLVQMTAGGRAVAPQQGSIIRVAAR